MECILQEMEVLGGQLEDCKAQLQLQSLNLQRKEGDLSCMAMELEAKTSSVAKLHEQISR